MESWNYLHFKFKLYEVRKTNLKCFVLCDSVYKRSVMTNSVKSRVLADGRDERREWDGIFTIIQHTLEAMGLFCNSPVRMDM